MTFREWIGLVMIVVGLLLVPVGWAFSRVLWFVGFGAFALGLWLFYTFRVYRRERTLEKAAGGQLAGSGVPTDIHNYTGWQHGGRSQTMDSRPETFEVDDADA